GEGRVVGGLRDRQGGAREGDRDRGGGVDPRRRGRRERGGDEGIVRELGDLYAVEPLALCPAGGLGDGGGGGIADAEVDLHGEQHAADPRHATEALSAGDKSRGSASVSACGSAAELGEVG